MKTLILTTLLISAPLIAEKDILDYVREQQEKNRLLYELKENHKKDLKEIDGTTAQEYKTMLAMALLFTVILLVVLKREKPIITRREVLSPEQNSQETIQLLLQQIALLQAQQNQLSQTNQITQEKQGVLSKIKRAFTS